MKPKTEQNNTYFKEILNTFPDGILIADETTRILFANTATLDRIKLTEQEVIGRLTMDLEEEGIFVPSITRLVLEQKKIMVEMQPEIGYENSFITTGYPIYNEAGKIVRVVSHSRYLPEIIESAPALEETNALLLRYSDEIRKMQIEQITAQETYQGKNPAFLAILEKIKRIAPTDSTLLITGETGVGKSFFAKRIHQLSHRHGGPFVEINCGAIPESLIESELFGYEKAAFTGASSSGKAGLIKMANNGTIFLDEIGEMPLHLQVKLLQFLQNKSFTPIGATKTQTANVRIIAATNRKLQDEVKKGTFRSDLFYRLNVLPLQLPALRDRPEDLVGMLYDNLHTCNERYNRQCYFTKPLIDVLQQYDWPGNIRELENVVERLILISEEEALTVNHLPEDLLQQSTDFSQVRALQEGEGMTAYLEMIEKQLIEEAVATEPTTRTAAEKLHITQSLLMRRINKYQIPLKNKKNQK